MEKETNPDLDKALNHIISEGSGMVEENRLVCPRCKQTGPSSLFKSKYSGEVVIRFSYVGELVEVCSTNPPILQTGTCECEACGYSGTLLEFVKTERFNGK